ncbi:MAG: HAMP domain-containing histidine kinase [Alphaproteobacteria bacterium]|nr:HAMP domain-containing histidine kinase [Alphaproteobacteria bacterium]MCB9690419.1 HAMP domain-containing histidine kinase [Alphaproteobacteria bacterium]
MGERDPQVLLVAELAEAGLAAASLAHEIRQPLFAIKALAQLGRAAGGLDPDALKEILVAVAHLEQLLDGWRHVGRQEPEGLHDLRGLAEEVARMLGPRAAAASAVLTVEAGAPVWAEGRPSIGRQVLLNLVQNALDAVQEHPERHVTVRFVERDALLGVEVHDTGPGVEAEVLASVFEPFVTTKGRGGTGLGLYVSRALCVAQGGDLTLDSADDGTRALAFFARAAG